MGAFGGSFLNHQYLVAAQPPYLSARGQRPGAKRTIAVLEGDDPTGIRPKLADDSPRQRDAGSARSSPRADALTPGLLGGQHDGPGLRSRHSTPDPHDPRLADASSPNTLPAQTHLHHRRRAVGASRHRLGLVCRRLASWRWTARRRRTGHFRSVPNFQPHHQPFNYFRQFAPGTAAREQHLRDAGFGETARQQPIPRRHRSRHACRR